MANKSELVSLIRKRGILKRRITEFSKYVVELREDCSEGVLEEEAEIELESRLARITNIINEYETIQENIDELVADATLKDENESYREEFESAYYGAITKAKVFLKNMKAQATPSSPALNSSLSSGPSGNQGNNLPGVKLPAIELPKFSGKFENWLEFRDAFDAIVHQSQLINNVQKFYYLKAFLEGDAAKLVASIQTTANNYPTAWARLCERYESKKLLVQSHIHSLFNMNKIHRESASQLREMLDKTMLSTRSINSLGISIDSWDPMLVFILSSKFDGVTAREWENYTTSGELPTFNEIAKFINDRANTLEILNFNKLNLSQVKSDDKANSSHNQYNSKFKNKSFAAFDVSCYLCKGQHTIYKCEDFIKLSITDRINKIKALKLCYNCLRRGHSSQDCKSQGCRHCKLRHNSLIHKERGVTPEMSPLGDTTLNTQTTLSSQVGNINGHSQGTYTLLSTAKVIVFRGLAQLECRIILDSGSQSNFITEAAVKRLNLPVQPIKIKVAGLNNSFTNIRGRCEVKFSSRNKSFTKTIQCLVVPEISDSLPQFEVDVASWNIPDHLFMADDNFNKPGEIDMLIGTSMFWNLMIMKRLELGIGRPILQKTKLGWIIAGPIGDIGNASLRCHFNKNLQVQEQLATFWELEEVSNIRNLSEDEQACELHFQNTVKRDSDGRFIVSMPLKHSIQLLGDSKVGAQRRFFNLEKKLKPNSPLRDQYNLFMREYQEMGHMSIVSKQREADQVEYFLPHHGVINESSVTTRLRVVFDGSFSSDSGYSINDLEYTGPTIQTDLISILLRFRQHAIAISADISKMYRQIIINESERALQQIFWRDDPSKDLDVYELNTVTYGRRAAPFVAIRCVKQLAKEHSDNVVSKLIAEDFYVDDFLSGCDEKEEAIEICNQVSQILLKGCFPLRKWISNNPDILNGLVSCEEKLKIMPIGETESTKTLGLFWNSNKDSLAFCVNQSKNHYKAVTKRDILSIISRIFDPLGLIGPCTIKAKILLQLIWKEKIDWDDSVPSFILEQWVQLHGQLQMLNDIDIPRYVLTRNWSRVELHGFADASEKAYGACIYLKSTNSQGTKVHLLCSKSKVAPLKFTTIPRLELCAALLLARLTKKVIESLRLTFNCINLWSDSQITLAWINSSVELLKVFVANRVTQILDLTDQTSWHYVPTVSNPADLVSRGVNPRDLKNSSLWWEGPQWLTTDLWPKKPTNKIRELPELKSVQRVFSATIIPSLIDIHRFSNYNRLLRTIAYVLRFIFNTAHAQHERRKGSLCPSELDNALSFLVRIVQAEMFREDLKELKLNGVVTKKSPIASLTPFLDGESVIRVGGRLQAAQLPYGQRHPIIITSTHYFTELLFRSEHVRLGHAGSQQLLGSIRERFWPVRGRPTAKRIVRACIKCFRVQPRNDVPQMGNLPGSRVNPSHPFQVSGVDYAGPFLIKTKRGRGAKHIKCYLALFVCFVSKAVHIEVVSDLTTNAFIAALRRFIARRGKPTQINSDNATNFVGAKNEMHRVLLELESDIGKIRDALAGEGVAWRFIPPRSPHFGGLWEAGVRLAKIHLKRIIDNTSAYTYEEFCTITCQVEAILNSRPLTSLSDNPEDLDPLTPSHFLIGRKLTALPESDLSGTPSNRLDNYQMIQQLIQQFWTRWRNEYLHQLQPRRKWKSTVSKPLRIGDLVLVKEDHVPPLSWPIGRVVQTYPGTDQIVRVADIRTSSGIFKRAAVQLFPLPSGSSTELFNQCSVQCV